MLLPNAPNMKFTQRKKSSHAKLIIKFDPNKKFNLEKKQKIFIATVSIWKTKKKKYDNKREHLHKI